LVGPGELKSSSLCLYSSNLGTFWLKIEQFWPFEEISIFSNGELCPLIPTSNQDGRQAKNRKKGGYNFNCPLLL
jgi:hypothetical protein